MQVYNYFQFLRITAAATEDSEAITANLKIFATILQQTCVKNKFNFLASIKPGSPIEFIVKGADLLYLDLNNTRPHVQAKITKEDETNIEADSRLCDPSLSLSVSKGDRQAKQKACERSEPDLPESGLNREYY